MAQIKNKQALAQQFREGIRAIADNLKNTIERVDREIAPQLFIEARTLKGWKNTSSVPDNIDDDKLLGLCWLILDQGGRDLTWLTRLLQATSLPVVEPPSVEWVRSCLKAAQIGKEPDNTPGAPDKADIEQLIRRLFPGQQKAIFISYSPANNLDRSLALEIAANLGQHFEVFIDQASPGGSGWAAKLEAALARADFFICLLSAHSVQSEMVQEELAAAFQLTRRKTSSGPVILPVRVAYSEPFQYPLNLYLNQINELFWESPQDTIQLVQKLKLVINSGEFPAPSPAFPTPREAGSLPGQFPAKLPGLSPALSLPLPLPSAPLDQLEVPEGTMQRQSRFYVERPEVDPIALKAITRPGITLTIKGPRQMGKSSLLVRVCQLAQKVGKQVIFLDFQLFDKEALANSETFFRQFCSWLSDELNMPDRVEEFWKMPLGNSQRCNRYLQRYLLKEQAGSLVLAMDEVERIFDCEFRSDFFSLLRSWHNNRQPDSVWKHLDLVLVTSTEPYLLIDSFDQSPFNVGQIIELNDFTGEQLFDLNLRHGSPLSPGEAQQLMDLVGGHPYLIRRALYLVAGGACSAASLFKSAASDRGPFGDHLRYHLFRLHQQEELTQALKQVLRNQTCPDDKVFFRLRGAGLVKKEGRAVVPRCQLYASYLWENLYA